VTRGCWIASVNTTALRARRRSFHPRSTHARSLVRPSRIDFVSERLGSTPESVELCRRCPALLPPESQARRAMRAVLWDCKNRDENTRHLSSSRQAFAECGGTRRTTP
jgi:hypothetical protein